MCLCFIALCHCRSVTVSRGPLLRVEGQPLSIRCDVSEYEGPREQDFDWTVTRGTESIKVISTLDTVFTDRSLQDRIQSGDISVSRLADNAVELRIQEARVSDSATYHCSTPSTDSFISGNYKADVQLQVVPNSLIVAPDVPNPVIHEGGSVRLLCNVSRNFMEGIYLSLTWSVKKGSSLLEDLLTFGPDLGVSVGDDYTLRYADGGMRLEMGNGVSHSLVLSGATPADQGMYMCTARLWTREQGAWNRIQEKTMEIGEVTVTPTVKFLPGYHIYCQCYCRVLIKSGRLQVSGEPSSRPYTNTNSQILVGCRCITVTLTVCFYLVCIIKIWIISVPSLMLAYFLLVFLFKSSASSLSVQVQDASTLSTGETLLLTCSVSAEASVDLEVTWLMNGTRVVARLSRDGVLTNASDAVDVRRLGKWDFQLKVRGVELSDAGLYACKASAWVQRDGGRWDQAAEKVSDPVQYTVVLSSSVNAKFSGDMTELECKVTNVSNLHNDVAYEMKWFLSRLRGSNSPSLLAIMDRWGVVHKAPRNDSSDCSLERLGPRKFAMNIHSTQDSDAGDYYCTATPWIRSTASGVWSKAPEVSSQRVFLNVKFALWDSMKLPLLYGVCASVTVGIVSLVLGLVCAHCCCKTTTPTPRSRNKLMELEMD
uniref:Si:ch211-132g1.7 n=1 Tax=Cyprinus carpio TaxID=7962 RepID=A0A8C2CJ77_CYPCA